MNIGTISFNINAPDFNYGAVLHSWAFQQYLKGLNGVEYTEVIDYTMPRLEGQNLEKPLISLLKNTHLKAFLRVIFVYRKYKERYEKFYEFERNNMSISREKYTQETLNNAKLPYNVVICESDVIWSHGFCGGHFDKSFFLALDSMKNMKRIAYAPSMADATLEKGVENEFKELLTHLDYISCRESYEKYVIEKYTEKEVEYVLDPVMLLEENDYNKITAKPLIKEKYIVIYLPVDENKKLIQSAVEYAKTRGLKVIEISTKLKKNKEKDIITYATAGIEEFLSAIKYSEIVFTNSFHAICFSIIFNKQFYAFSRNYSGKVEDICKNFGLEDRYFSTDNFKELDVIDYNTVNEIWKIKRENSKRWLEQKL